MAITNVLVTDDPATSGTPAPGAFKEDVRRSFSSLGRQGSPPSVSRAAGAEPGKDTLHRLIMKEFPVPIRRTHLDMQLCYMARLSRAGVRPGNMRV